MLRLFLEVEPKLDSREAANNLTMIEALVRSLERQRQVQPGDRDPRGP